MSETSGKMARTPPMSCMLDRRMVGKRCILSTMVGRRLRRSAIIVLPSGDMVFMSRNSVSMGRMCAWRQSFINFRESRLWGFSANDMPALFIWLFE